GIAACVHGHRRHGGELAGPGGHGFRPVDLLPRPDPGRGKNPGVGDERRVCGLRTRPRPADPRGLVARRHEAATRPRATPATRRWGPTADRREPGRNRAARLPGSPRLAARPGSPRRATWRRPAPPTAASSPPPGSPPPRPAGSLGWIPLRSQFPPRWTRRPHWPT